MPENQSAHRRKQRPPTRVSPWERHLWRIVLALGGPVRRSAGFGRPRGILHIFRLAERIMEGLHPSQVLHPGGVVRYEILKLPQGRLPLTGRRPVLRGERVIGLHFDNRAIARLAQTSPDGAMLAWSIGRAGRADLRALADLVRRGRIPSDVRAIWAETIFYPALARYGFHTRPAPPTVRTPFARLFLLSLIAMYGRPQAGMESARRARPLELGEAWMALDDLLRRFPATAADHRSESKA